jgi:hypothetical protein
MLLPIRPLNGPNTGMAGSVIGAAAGTFQSRSAWAFIGSPIR